MDRHAVELGRNQPERPLMPVAMKIRHETDPAADIFREVGDLSRIKLMFNSVLIATYVRPVDARRESGLIIPTKVTDEDRYQSKVGLVLMKGPTAYKDDLERANPIRFHGYKV